MPAFFILQDGGDCSGASLKGFLAVLAFVGEVVLGTTNHAEVIFAASVLFLWEEFSVGT